MMTTMEKDLQEPLCTNELAFRVTLLLQFCFNLYKIMGLFISEKTFLTIYVATYVLYN